MIKDTIIEIQYLIFSLLSGVLAGVLFDVYNLIKGKDTGSKIITAIQDVLFWILTSILVFIFLLYTNNAYVSIYIYLFILIGFFLYIKLFSTMMRKIILVLYLKASKGIRVTIKFLLFPIKSFFYAINRKRE